METPHNNMFERGDKGMASGEPEKKAFPNVPDSDASSIENEEKPIDDTARLTQYPDGNEKAN